MKFIKIAAWLLVLTTSQWVFAEASLVGTWELEYAIYKNDKGAVVGEIKDQSTKSRKVLSKNYFTFVTWEKNGKFSAAGSGKYVFKGSSYEETVDASSAPILVGKTYSFNAVINKNVWIHKGMEDGILIEEHWRLIE